MTGVDSCIHASLLFPEEMMKRLPIGIQTFENLIQEQEVVKKELRDRQFALDPL